MDFLKRFFTGSLFSFLLVSIVIASEFVQPTIDNLPVFSSDGTKIGVLRKKVTIHKLRETQQMVLIEYSDESVYFTGWVSKSYVKSSETSGAVQSNSSAIAEKPAPKNENTIANDAVTVSKTRFNIPDTRKEIRQILKVPVNYIQQTEVNKLQNNSSKNKQSSSQQSKVYVKLNPNDKNSDGYAEITVLLEFERDSIVTFFVNEKIEALKVFKEQAALEYSQVIDLYIQALLKYNEDLRGNFITLCGRAEKYEAIIK